MPRPAAAGNGQRHDPHGAKGLEFDYVFLPGWEDGLFPSQRSMDDTGIAGLEESGGWPMSA